MKQERSMRKKDVLKILTTSEAAEVINKHPAQVTRMPKQVPIEYKKTLISACAKKIKRLSQILDRMRY